MKSAIWRRRRGPRGFGTILLIASGLLMAVPLVSAHAPSAPIAGLGTTTATPAVANGTSCGVGTTPEFAAYDPVNHYVYVPNSGSSTVSILNGACKTMMTVPLYAGSKPWAAAFNPTNNWVYVTDRALDQVYVLSGISLIKTIPNPDDAAAFDAPTGIAFDPGDAIIAVANHGSDTVTFIEGSTVMGYLIVGSEPGMFTYDPYYGQLLVTNYGSNSVTALNATEPFAGPTFTIPVGSKPVGIAFDYADSEDYVANSGSKNVTVLSLDYEVGSVKVGSDPQGVVWDQAKLSVYVANSGSSTVSVIKGGTVVRTISGPSSSKFAGITYDEATDQVFVIGSASKAVIIYDAPVVSAGPVASGTICAENIEGEGYTQDPAYDPVNHDVYVPMSYASLTIFNGACKLVATISTFPSGAYPIAAAFNPTNNLIYVTDNNLNQVYVISGTKLVKTITSSTFDEPLGVAFDPGDALMAVANNGSDTVTFLSGTQVYGTTTVGSGPQYFAYDPYFGEFLVTNFGSNSVTALNATDPFSGPSLTIPVGSPEGVAFDYADSEDYVAEIESSKVDVIDGVGNHIGSVKVGTEPTAIVWDQAKLSMYVVNFNPFGISGSLTVVKGLSHVRTISSYLGIYFSAYDEATDQVFVTDALGGVIIYT